MAEIVWLNWLVGEQLGDEWRNSIQGWQNTGMGTLDNREKRKKKKNIWEGSLDGSDVLVEAVDQRGKCSHWKIKAMAKTPSPAARSPATIWS
jgi:hypothetical protein